MAAVSCKSRDMHQVPNEWKNLFFPPNDNYTAKLSLSYPGVSDLQFPLDNFCLVHGVLVCLSVCLSLFLHTSLSPSPLLPSSFIPGKTMSWSALRRGIDASWQQQLKWVWGRSPSPSPVSRDCSLSWQLTHVAIGRCQRDRSLSVFCNVISEMTYRQFCHIPFVTANPSTMQKRILQGCEYHQETMILGTILETSNHKGYTAASQSLSSVLQPPSYTPRRQLYSATRFFCLLAKRVERAQTVSVPKKC